MILLPAIYKVCSIRMIPKAIKITLAAIKMVTVAHLFH
jgi:hypothetical protein